MTASARERLLAATFECVARYGIAKTTVEDVARQAGLSRATVYRQFPGGKEQLVNNTIAWEAGRFFERLTVAVADAPDLETLLIDALMFAHQAFEEHAVLQKVLETEPELLVPQLTVESTRLTAFIRNFLAAPLERARAQLVPGLDIDWAADHIARLVLSFVGTPGRWDLTDRPQVEQLVRTELLAGVLA
ncbi:MAG TPA: TetR/AcrR family transcriptional regulator [Acidimicrobiales bacterium]|nr:TetR/AcrR family transcriptional regulator [Acidimicrobiales bacterium]